MLFRSNLSSMPLSDREKKVLAEMEAALSQDDPRLVSTLTGSIRTPARSRALYGALAVVAGMVILLGGLIAQIIYVGLIGFVIALVGAFIAISNFRISPEIGIQTPRQNKKRWSSRLEERWDRRNYDN